MKLEKYTGFKLFGAWLLVIVVSYAIAAPILYYSAVGIVKLINWYIFLK